MPKRFELTAQLDHDVRDVHAALTDARYWQGRLEGSATATLQIDAPDGPGSLRVAISERTEPADLPPMVRALVRGPMIMERIDRWGPLAGNGATGEIIGGTSGIPVSFRGRTRVLPHGSGGTVLDVRGDVSVEIPVVGRQIAALATRMVAQIVERDRDALAAWLTR
ncbi:DUF2505 domain-containing protein [Rhodococcus chondri]|uniref:DUF2505 domain-containing protein n=1 Tax=Rhodococcus chondri TaxID=3065941 RepID=A0ABU7JU14_9NOCA|nr:DUF2505 domain-containing protein [Rhodococcus sp. CC-R104]MEE2033414.1 DUF2505 domain-containing protein [Rhodococcus sp. CC-R104]